MAFTLGVRDAGSNLDHMIKLQVKGFTSIHFLPDLPKDAYQEQKGDLWKLSIENFFGFTTCVTIHDILNVSIVRSWPY